MRPSVQFPAGTSGSAVYTGFEAKGKVIGAASGRLGRAFIGIGSQHIGKLHGELHAVPNLAGASGFGCAGGGAQLIERGQQKFEIAGKQFVPECGIPPGARQIVVGYRREIRH
jgi:hypothetical protein